MRVLYEQAEFIPSTFRIFVAYVKTIRYLKKKKE